MWAPSLPCNLVELESFFGQTAQLMTVSATGGGLAMDIIRVKKQQILSRLNSKERLGQEKQGNKDTEGSSHGGSSAGVLLILATTVFIFMVVLRFTAVYDVNQACIG